MSPSERKLYDRIRRRAAMLEPQAARRLLMSYDIIRQSLTGAEMNRAITRGHVEQLVNLLNDDVLDPAFAPLRELIDRAAIDEGRAWTKEIPNRFTPPMFDVLNPRVIDAVRRLDTRVIGGLKDEVRETVRHAAEAGLRAGKHPRVVARNIRGVIGLAPNQSDAVQNFRGLLEAGDRGALTRALRDHRFDATLDKALGAGGKGLSTEQIDKMVTAYQNRMVAYNTETHTRTIALDTQRLAQRNSWINAIEQGYVDGDRLVRVWVTVGDDRVRPEHQAMNGEEVPFEGGVYSNGDTIPGENDYNCRCIERITLTVLVR